MSTIWDRAVRVVGDVLRTRTGAPGYYCGGGPCGHPACIVVAALANADLLAFPEHTKIYVCTGAHPAGPTAPCPSCELVIAERTNHPPKVGHSCDDPAHGVADPAERYAELVAGLRRIEDELGYRTKVGHLIDLLTGGPTTDPEATFVRDALGVEPS